MSQSLSLNEGSTNWKLIIGLSLILGYCLVFLLFFAEVGLIIASLAIVPVTIIGWQWGLRAGLVAGLLIFLLNALLFHFVGIREIDLMLREGMGLGSLIIILVGVTSG